VVVSLSPNGTNLYESPSPASEVLVATANGVVTLARLGPTGGWRESGRELSGKHVGAIAVEPRSGTILAGVHEGGLWASEDGGQTWERRDQGIGSDDIYGLNCVQAGSEVRVYAGTEPAHLYCSTDLGRTWSELPALRDVPGTDEWTFPAPPHIAHTKNIAFDPGDPNTIYVAVEVGGAYKSTDGGQTWRTLTGYYRDVHRLLTVPSRPDHVYMSTGRALYHSADRGDTWEEWALTDPGIFYPDGFVVVPRQPDLMFTSGSASNPGRWRTSRDADARLARSRDGGRTWERLENGLPAHIRGNVEALTLNVHPAGFELFAATTDGDVFYSDDEGDHWTTIAQGLPPISKAGHYQNLRDDLVATH
jgi:photosystem II stability/assembly factor-like uncharacterized protein